MNSDVRELIHVSWLLLWTTSKLPTLFQAWTCVGSGGGGGGGGLGGGKKKEKKRLKGREFMSFLVMRIWVGDGRLTVGCMCVSVCVM